MNSFDQAFNSLLSMAPGPLFPRARQLYLCKYSLEGPDGPQRFRTFLYQEQVEEQPEGLVRVRGLAFAVVHWQAPQTTPDDYATYLQQRWQLQPSSLGLELVVYLGATLSLCPRADRPAAHPAVAASWPGALGGSRWVGHSSALSL